LGETFSYQRRAFFGVSGVLDDQISPLSIVEKSAPTPAHAASPDHYNDHASEGACGFSDLRQTAFLARGVEDSIGMPIIGPHKSLMNPKKSQPEGWLLNSQGVIP
jgi:hypothetical protein